MSAGRPRRTVLFPKHDRNGDPEPGLGRICRQWAAMSFSPVNHWPVPRSLDSAVLLDGEEPSFPTECHCSQSMRPRAHDDLFTLNRIMNAGAANMGWYEPWL